MDWTSTRRLTTVSQLFGVSFLTLASIGALVLLEIIPMTLAAILAIVILAAVNAWAPLAPARQELNVVESEEQSYFLWFFQVEIFWRAFITNLSFGGVSLSIGVIAFQSRWGFWDIDNPIVPLLLNFAMGLLVPYELKDELRPPLKKAWCIIAVGISFYLYAAFAAWHLYRPSDLACGTTS